MKTILSTILLIYTIQGFSQNYIGDKKEIETILNSVTSFSDYVMASDYEKLGGSYTEDAKIFPNNKDIIVGKKAITDYWRLPKGVQTSYHKVTPSEIRINNDEAYDYGYYEGITKRANGEEVSWKGKYVIVWKRIDDDWKIYLDIWNRIAN